MEKEEQLLTRILIEKFDARDEMERAVQRLSMLMIKPIQSFLINHPEEEARISQQQRDKALSEINLAQQSYTERLESAKDAGEIDSKDYFRAQRDASGMFSPFERMRQEAREEYRNVVKFG